METINVANELKEAALHYKQDAPTDAWQGIQGVLHKKENKNRRWLLLPLLAITFGAGYYWGNTNTEKNICALQNAVVLHASTITTTNKNHQVNNESINKVKNAIISKLNTSKDQKLTIPFKEVDWTAIATKTVEQLNIGKEKKNIPVTVKKENSDEEKSIENGKIDNTTVEELVTNKAIITDTKTAVKTDISNDSTNEKIAQLLANIPVPVLKSDVSSTKKNRIKKWQPKISAAILLLTISENNFIQKLSEQKSLNNGVLSGTSFGPGAIVAPKLTVTNASMQQLQLLWQTQHKKWQYQIGTQLQYGSYNADGHFSPLANINTQNGALLLDNNQSNLSATRVLRVPFANNKVVLQNKFLHAGIMLGVNKPIKVQQKTIATINYQMVPSVALYQNVYWFNNTTAQIWKNKNYNSNFVLYNNLAVDFNVKIRQSVLQISPVYSFSAFSKLNKNNDAISNSNVNALGLRLSILLK